MSFEPPKKPEGQPLVTVTPISAPTFRADTFHAICTQTDAYIVVNRAHPCKSENGELAPFMAQETVAVMTMSIATLKDLSAILASQVAEYERKTGLTIETEYTRRLAAKA